MNFAQEVLASADLSQRLLQTIPHSLSNEARLDVLGNKLSYSQSPHMTDIERVESLINLLCDLADAIERETTMKAF